MRFDELLADLQRHGATARRADTGSENPEILEVGQRADSMPAGSVFVAVRGMHTDAHELVPVALGAGAAALIVEREVAATSGFPVAVVADSRAALALAAAALAGHPTERMALVGITGTDGKTTTSILTAEALLAAGVRAGAMTSLDFRCLDQVEVNPTYMTTLEATAIQPRMRDLVEAGVTTAVLETTSHGIALQRVTGVAYDVAAYTNLTHEHLDFHATMEEYRDVKLRLARMAWESPRKPGVPKALVYSADEPAWTSLARAPADRRVSYGFGAGADLRAVDLRPRIGGMAFDVVVEDRRLGVDLNLMGRFNAANALCALAICHALGLDLERAAAGLAQPRGLRGRMEVVQAGQPFAVVVDYAHTPDGLEQVLTELRGLTSGRLLAIFGAPGDRDPSKRPLMGAAVGRGADRFLVTTDDPRHESVAEISAAIAEGARSVGRREGGDFELVPDRREAIRRILSEARHGDTVLLAGKGHEDRMLVGTRVLPWSDVVEAKTALRELGLSAGRG
ncbi:MAG: UDP-N-acetylmuramoyl-L-alanyl-D-glutamate--2,6-diaminopimelate ligase [Candidatus Dormibacteria bacterium]